MTLRIRSLAVGMAVGLLVLLFVFLVFLASYISTFTKTAGISFSELVTTGKEGFLKRNEFQNKQVTFLFLGLDKRDDVLEHTLLTDSILMGSINTTTGDIRTIPLPRDLWIAELQTKINALYFYGEKDGETNGISFTEKELYKITGISPDFTVVIEYPKLPALIDTVGGVDISVERTFVGNQYPNPSYVEGSVGSSPYITVRFDQGSEHMDGERTLTYIRSRGSEDPQEGSDAARSKRQMIVLQALISQMKTQELLQNPEKMGTLYKFFHEEIKTSLTDPELTGLGLLLRKKTISFQSIQIPTVAVENQPAILVHPSISKYGLWVWEPKDPSWEELKEFIKSNIF